MGTTAPYSGSPEAAARAFLQEHQALFRIEADPQHLQHVRTQGRRGIQHVRFQQMYEGLPIEGAVYLVHLRADGRVDMANGTYYTSVEMPSTQPRLTAHEALRRAEGALPSAPAPNESTRPAAERVIYPRQGESAAVPAFVLAWKTVVSSRDHTAWEVFVDALSGEVLDRVSLIIDGLSAASDPAGADAPAAGPLAGRSNHPIPAAVAPASWTTGSGQSYLTHPGLDPTVQTVALNQINHNGIFYNLEGYYIRVVNNEAGEATSVNGNFYYATSSTHFAEVNAYYHAHRFRANYINALGFDGFRDLSVYVHGNHPEGPHYDPPSGDIFLAWNSSVIHDPALEDKVVQHEYVHAVFHDITGAITGASNEAGAVSEGLGDYFAGAFTGRSQILDYILAPTDSRRRNMAAPEIATYQLPFNHDSHLGGEFFSAILWGLRNNPAVEPDNIDDDVFGAMYRLDTDPTFIEFREAMLAEDRAIDSGRNVYYIQQAFANRGVPGETEPDPMGVMIGGPTCQAPGVTVSFHATSIWGGVPPYTYTWQFKKSCGITGVPCNAWNGTLQGTASDPPDVTPYAISQNYDYQVRLRLVDDTGLTRYSNTKFVNYDPVGYCQGVDPPLRAGTAKVGTAQAVSSATATAAAAHTGSASLPDALVLEPAYPNPFAASATVPFAVPEAAHVRIVVYDALGRAVATLADETYAAGHHRVLLSGDALPAGTYLLRAVMQPAGEDASQVLTQRVTVLR